MIHLTLLILTTLDVLHLLLLQHADLPVVYYNAGHHSEGWLFKISLTVAGKYRSNLNWINFKQINFMKNLHNHFWMTWIMRSTIKMILRVMTLEMTLIWIRMSTPLHYKLKAGRHSGGWQKLYLHNFW